MSAAPHVPGRHEIETVEGRYIDLTCPDHRQLSLYSIAHALSNTCRYGGSCREFFSVSEHAVIVSRIAERRGENLRICMAALHHDDAEWALGDIPRPLKPLIGPEYKRLTVLMDRAVWRALGWPNRQHEPLWHLHAFELPAVKVPDRLALAAEARYIMASRGAGWHEVPEWDVPETGEDVLPACLRPRQARHAYIARHHELVRRIYGGNTP